MQQELTGFQFADERLGKRFSMVLKQVAEMLVGVIHGEKRNAKLGSLAAEHVHLGEQLN